MTAQSDLRKAMSHLTSGAGKKAYLEARSVLRKTPRSPSAHNIAGLALSAMGRHADASKAFHKAIQIAPDFLDARRNLAQALVLAGSFDKARTVLKKLVDQDPDDERTWYLCAQCDYLSGRLRHAEEAASRGLTLAPASARSRTLRALIREKRGDFNGMLADCEEALRRDPTNVDALVNISLPLARQLQVSEALAAVEKAIKLAPNHLGARQRYAMHLEEGGDQERAAEAWRAVLSLQQHDGLAIEHLSRLQSADQNTGSKRLAIRALKTAQKKSENRASLFFAMGHLARQSGDLQAETDNLARANRDMAAIQPHDTPRDSAWEAQICGRFQPGAVVAEHHLAGPTPIFVIGLPRSGTTLAEAILGAHPDVQPLGERAAAGVLLKETIERDLPFDGEAIEVFRAGDAALLPRMQPGIVAYVDKMPENYRLVGFLKQAYPGCTIINITRDPRDIALSMWRGHFAGRALSYTYDQRAMAHRFNLYARMMRHWHAVFPGQILDVAYEDMVGDVSAISKRMADHCGLDWCEEMTAPHESAQQVLTLSATQLRQPVHRKSIGGWRNYKAALRVVLDGLDPDLWGQYLG